MPDAAVSRGITTICLEPVLLARVLKELQRAAIEKALVSREPLRNIAKRVSISPAGLLRHKRHVAQAIVKASEKREERLGDSLIDEMRRVQHKAWELLAKTESEGDHRASIVALREVRECLESLGEMLAKADTPQGLQLTLAHRLEAARRRLSQDAAQDGPQNQIESNRAVGAEVVVSKPNVPEQC